MWVGPLLLMDGDAGQTRFRSMKPELCLAFALSRLKDEVFINDVVPGGNALCDAMLQMFLQENAEWHLLVAHDAENSDTYWPVAAVVADFTVNPTIVWRW